MRLIDRFGFTIEAIAILYALYIQGGLVGIAAVIAVTENLVKALNKYA